MICVNELTSLKSHNKQILEKVIILLAPFAPHISEELWHELGYDSTVCDARWPEWKEEYLKEQSVLSSHTYLTNSDPTLNEWYEIWINTFCKNVIKDYTVNGYEQRFIAVAIFVDKISTRGIERSLICPDSFR